MSQSVVERLNDPICGRIPTGAELTVDNLCTRKIRHVGHHSWEPDRPTTDTQADRIRDVLAVLRTTQEWIAGEPERHRQAMLIGAQAEALEQIERIVKAGK